MYEGDVSQSGVPLEWPVTREFVGESAALRVLQQALFQTVWKLNAPIQTNISSLTNYYLARVNLIDPYELAIENHLDVVEIVDFVRNRKSHTRSAIRDDLRSSSPRWLGNTRLSSDTAIDLAIQLWLLSDPTQFQADDCVIVDQLSKQFERAGNQIIAQEFELDFDAAFFERVAGISIIGTQCFTDHLRYDRKHRILTVFDVADFLNSSRSQEEQKLFPPGLLLETRKSLALLFPQGRSYPSGISSRRKQPDIEMAVSDRFSDVHDPNSYVYWQQRLLVLHSVYSKAQPSKFMQFWRDRRDTNQWTTLWLAVLVIFLTLVFGLIQSVTGILQVIIAYRQLQIK